MKLKIFTISLLITCGLFIIVSMGCGTTIEHRLNALKAPVTIIAISKKGSVLLKDAENTSLLITRDYCLALAISNSYKVGDILIPAIRGSNEARRL